LDAHQLKTKFNELILFLIKTDVYTAELYEFAEKRFHHHSKKEHENKYKPVMDQLNENAQKKQQLQNQQTLDNENQQNENNNELENQKQKEQLQKELRALQNKKDDILQGKSFKLHNGGVYGIDQQIKKIEENIQKYRRKL
jgi:hypothetical protein